MHDDIHCSCLQAVFSPQSDEDSFQRWRASLSEVIDVRRVEATPSDFRARISLRKLATALIMQTEAAPQIMEQSRKHIRRLGVEHVSINIVLGGCVRGNYDGAAVTAQRNDVFLRDETRPSVRHYTDFNILGLYIPRTSAPRLFKMRNTSGMVFSESASISRLLQAHIRLMAQAHDGMAPEEMVAATEAAFLLASGAIQAKYSLEAEHRTALDRTIKNLTEEYIDKNLADPALSVDLVCERLRVSRSRVYRLFEAEGGISRYIFDSRLDHCFGHLECGLPKRMSIGELALTHGFKSEAHFSRAFRHRFGLSPRDVRGLKSQTRADGQNLPGEISAETAMLNWFRAHPPR